MKFINKTHWHTPDLAKIIRRCERLELNEMSRERRKRITCRIAYTKGSGRGSSGYATYNGFNWTVRVGKDFIDKVDFAGVCVHEMAHLRGLHHDRMNGKPKYDRVGNYRELYAWANDFEIRLAKVATAKPKADVQETRYSRVLNNIKGWETKLKRAQNALKKYRQQQRYYERALAAKGIKPQEEK
jgi:hypothetical protein